jgi:hypothetical protein
MQERFVRTDLGYERISWTYTSSNSLGRVVETLHANRTRSENDWSCRMFRAKADQSSPSISCNYFVFLLAGNFFLLPTRPVRRGRALGGVIANTENNTARLAVASVH